MDRCKVLVGDVAVLLEVIAPAAGAMTLEAVGGKEPTQSLRHSHVHGSDEQASDYATYYLHISGL